MRVGKEVSFMPEGKTIGQLMEEMRQKAGAQNYHGHDYMDLQRFAENTRHMIIFDVLTHDSPVGWKGERTRLFLSDKGYEKALDSQAKELGSLNDQLESSNDSETDSSVDSSQDVQEEGTISPSHSSESSTDESLNSLLSQIKPLLPQNNGTWSVYVCNLMKNTEGVIDDQPMQAASLIKLFIMGTVYENYESLSETYGADTLNSYLNSMITVSDNDAANKLVNMLGDSDDEAGMRAVNAFCASHGYSSTSMGRLLLQSNEYGDNYTSVSDCGHFLKEIYQSNAGTAESTLAHTDAMYSLLKMQQRRNKIPANLPDGVKVANKTGELDDVENDAGIIYNTAKNIDLVVCFMSQDLTDSSEAQAVIAQDSRLIYGYYNE